MPDATDILEELRKRVSKAPTEPGVYRWLNAKGETLYIGKAKNLKNRLKSYVQKEVDKSLGPWKLSLRKHIADFDVTVTESELEALILETNMIKEAKPKYNVLMKDDKNYVYVRVSKERYPSIEVVRQMAEDDAKYFGPYLSSYNINRTLDALHDIFAFRACKKSIEKLNRADTVEHPCLEQQIGQCNGLCTGAVSEKQYQEGVQHVCDFLRGNHKDATFQIKTMMEKAATEKKFEKAAKLRDTLLYIESIGVRQIVSDTSRENTDAIGIALQNGKVQVVVLRERNGKLVEERSIVVGGEPDSIEAVITELLPQYYGAETDIPDLVLIQEEIADKQVLESWLKQIKNRSVEIRSPERGKKSKLLALAEANAKQKIEQQFAKWESATKNIETALQELKDSLGLESVPKRIEGYDISHLGGTETVGSMVVCKNGKPANKEYRSFTIRTMQSGEIDDYKALKEVLSRRLRHLHDPEKEWDEKGIAIGKAKKADLKQIEEIHERNKATLSSKNIDYKTYVVAKKEQNIVAMGRLVHIEEADAFNLRSLWVADEFRGQKLGQVVTQKLLKNAKAEKTYLITDPSLEEYYAQIGFRYVQTPPQYFIDINTKLKKRMNEHGTGMPCGLVMVFIPLDNKEDVSLKSEPDLLVIDGGKGQLNAVTEVLEDLQLQIPVIGLAKREEEVFVPGSSLPIDLPNDSQGSFLLQRLRNEAHRFANSHREKRIAKGLIGSALDAISGIGPKTKKELLDAFGSVDGITKASDEELLKVISEKQLKLLRENL